MAGKLLRYFFAHNISVALAISGAVITYLLMTGHYIAAAIGFVICVAVCVAGERALDRR